jgi:nucleoside-diphosphate-sugar epimerase/SAM-dependent methyltransferase
MDVLITGGTGFIGSRLALACLRRGDRVRVLGQTNTAAEGQNAAELEAAGGQITLGSVLETASIERALRDADVVYHLAACQHEANVPDRRFWDVNVTGTRNVLEASVKARVRRFVHGSTIGVYRASRNEITRDDSPLEPGHIYGRTKLEAERDVRDYMGRLPAVIIRIPETYGPADRRLLKLFRSVEKGRNVMVGAGTNLHHPIYIDDLIEVLFAAATRSEAVGKTFVVAGPKAITTREMVEAIGRELGRKGFSLTVPFGPLWLAALAMERTLGPLGIQPPLHRRRMNFFALSFAFAGEDAREALGFTPRVSFEEGVRRTADWYRSAGLLPSDGPLTHAFAAAPARFSAGADGAGGGGTSRDAASRDAASRDAPRKLSARTEPFDSFWEAPADVEKGYASFGQFYSRNYLARVPQDRSARILVVSCGPGYFVHMLAERGYVNVLGIDSFPSKIDVAKRHGLNCRTAEAFRFLEESRDSFDLIFCEQELNHLTKDEMVDFLNLCRSRLSDGGRIIVHGLNGANPLTGPDAAAQNFDHFNTFTEYSLRQVLEYCGFRSVRVFPLNLYVFYKNPMNYAAWAAAAFLSLVFRVVFVLYGKTNKIWTKKLAAVGTRRVTSDA